MKVLIVDDQPDLAELLAVLVQGEGCESVTASNGAEGLLEYWRAVNAGFPFGLIFLDFALPGPEGLDGLAVARRIRLAEHDNSIPRAYLCGYTAHPQNVLDPSALERAGLDKYLVKGEGNGVEELRAVIAEARQRWSG